MAKKTAVEPKRRLTAGDVIGTILRSIVVVFGFVFKLIFKACKILGLWIPIVYGLFGLILYWAVGFNPFLFDTVGTLYLCGFIACVIGAGIIAVRNVFVKPAKSVYEGYKHPLWEKQGAASDSGEESRLERLRREDRDARLAPPEIKPPVKKKEKSYYDDMLAPLSDFDSVLREENERRSVAPKPPKQTAKREKPKIYISTLQPDVIVHEYSDRFELFSMNGHKLTLIGVEYK